MIGNYIKAVAPAVSRSTAQLMKTGQTTSYATGSDGDLERGRNVSFTVLAENNPFGNTNRFTDELGTQTYTNNIVIDWSTYNGSNVLGWYRVPNASDVAWGTAITSALAFSIGTFTTGWRLPNWAEYFSIINWELPGSGSLPFSYSPFNIGNLRFWSSTTDRVTTTQAYCIQSNLYNNAFATSVAKSSVFCRWIAVRNFTVTGTTLS